MERGSEQMWMSAREKERARTFHCVYRYLHRRARDTHTLSLPLPLPSYRFWKIGLVEFYSICTIYVYSVADANWKRIKSLISLWLSRICVFVSYIVRFIFTLEIENYVCSTREHHKSKHKHSTRGSNTLERWFSFFSRHHQRQRIGKEKHRGSTAARGRAKRRRNYSTNFDKV